MRVFFAILVQIELSQTMEITLDVDICTVPYVWRLNKLSLDFVENIHDNFCSLFLQSVLLFKEFKDWTHSNKA